METSLLFPSEGITQSQVPHVVPSDCVLGLPKLAGSSPPVEPVHLVLP